jgi:predicted GNAT family N-acyltransferase
LVRTPAHINYTFINKASPEWNAVKKLRHEVFVDELHVPKHLEIDEGDAAARHLCVSLNEQLVGTLRILVFGHCATIGRVAVADKFRRQGIGTAMMKYAINGCRGQGLHHIKLGSQLYISGFYKSLGFKCSGNEYLDAGIPHIPMELELKR